MSDTSQKRLDIQGLRAVAVLLVVIYHAGAPWLPGGYVGVDVFFVISGFLITGGLVRELRTNERISWIDFYARRALRILPAASLAIVAVVALTWAFLPRIRWNAIWGDALASLFYVQNWRLAETSTDYLTGTQAPSPLQHFWSLAVEEQFYILWPLLLTLATLPLGLRHRRSRRRRIRDRQRYLRVAPFVVFAIVLVPSLLWSIYLTPRDPSAYFATTTRIWELALGAGLAVALPAVRRVPPAAAAVLGWGGLSAILIAAATFTGETSFPGYHALLPTLGAAALIAAADTASWGPRSILTLRPVTFIGDISYSYYLWHWPLLVVAAAQMGELTFPEGAAVAALAIVPSWLSYVLVERPALARGARDGIRDAAGKVGAFAVAGALVVSLSLALSAWPPAPPGGGPSLASLQTGADKDEVKYGAAVLGNPPRNDPDGDPVDKVAEMIPSPEQARSSASGCSAKIDDAEMTSCTYGDRTSDFDVAIVGDSHAAQWSSTIGLIAEDEGWLVTEYTKQSCPFGRGLVSYDGKPYPSCEDWNAEVEATLTANPPDLLLISSFDQPKYDANGQLTDDAAVEGMVETFRAMKEIGTRIVVLGPTPLPRIDIPDCISANLDNLTACAVDRDAAADGGDIMLEAARKTDLPVVDLFDAICPGDQCAAVIGSIIIYADTSHLTKIYLETLRPRLQRQLDSALSR